MKEGDLVRIIRVPDGIQDSDEFKTLSMLRRCVGRVFPIVGFNEYGMFQIDVGELSGKPSYMESVWIEPECVERVDK